MKRHKRNLTPAEPPAAAATDESDSPSHSSALLPSLPDDIALQCIARVPHSYHIGLSLVSKSWRSMFRSQFFLSTYRRLNCNHYKIYLNAFVIRSLSISPLKLTNSNWIALDLDPSNPKKPINLSVVSSIPSKAGRGTAAAILGHRIYVLGGYFKGARSNTVWILDCEFNRWEIGPKMSVERESALAGVLNGKIYVMGGCSEDSTDWAEVLDPAFGGWVTVPSPVEVRRMQRVYGGVRGKRFYILNRLRKFMFDPCGDVAESSWREVSKPVPRPALFWRRDQCLVDGILYYPLLKGDIMCLESLDVKKRGEWHALKWVDEDGKPWRDASWMNVDGRLCVVWRENRAGKESGIFVAEVDTCKDNNGKLRGSIVWSQRILAGPVLSIDHCFVVEV